MGCGIANERVAAEPYDDRSNCSTWAVALLTKELLQNPMDIELAVVHGLWYC